MTIVIANENISDAELVALRLRVAASWVLIDDVRHPAFAGLDHPRYELRIARTDADDSWRDRDFPHPLAAVGPDGASGGWAMWRPPLAHLVCEAN